MQNKPFTRIGDKLVMDMEKPICILGIYPCTVAGNKTCECYEFNNRPSYPINPSDLKEFEEGKQYENGKHFYILNCCANSCDGFKCESGKVHQLAYPIHKPEQKKLITEIMNEDDKTGLYGEYKPEQKTIEDDYIPFGDEWEKEVMKLPKKFLINMYRKVCITNKERDERLKKVSEENQVAYDNLWNEKEDLKQEIKERDERIAKLEKVAKELNALIQNIFED